MNPEMIDSEVYARSALGLGNGTFTPDGRLVVSHHPMYETPERVSVFTGSGALAPFPDLEWNTPREDSENWLDAVLGLRTDSRGRVWLLDMGTRSGVTLARRHHPGPGRGPVRCRESTAARTPAERRHGPQRAALPRRSFPAAEQLKRPSTL